MRIVIADDNLLVRRGIAALLEEAGLQVIAQAGEVDGLLDAVEAEVPDVAIVDIRMPPTHTDEGLVAAQQIRREQPETGVLLLSHYVEPSYDVPLKRGQFFTVEPMINLGRPAVKVLSDGWTAVTRDRSLSAQYEHTVAVTETGVEIFTVSPKGFHQPSNLPA